MMRALFVHSGNLYGGVETALVSLARARQRGIGVLEPSFALCFDDGRVGQELRAAGAVVRALGAVRISRPWSVRRARLRLRQLLRTRQYDVCVTQSAWTHALFASAIRAEAVPLVQWAHDRLDRDRWLDRWALRWPPDLVIANSRYTADGMQAVLGHVPVHLVHCPVEPAKSGAGRRKEIREEFATPQDAVVVVQVARMDPYKGHRMVIEALSRLSADPSWRCWIVGGVDSPLQGAYRQQLEHTADRAGIADRITFTGARADIAAILGAADVFCHPNISPEPFGIVFIEALRAGLPVIGCANGGVLDIVTDDCGRLVRPADPEALAAALAELVGSPGLRRTLGGNGPARASALCDPADRIAEMVRAFSTVCPAAVVDMDGAASPTPFPRTIDRIA
jgi:glycosyltransferase involved in cell wall biosynthesis